MKVIRLERGEEGEGEGDGGGGKGEGVGEEGEGAPVVFFPAFVRGRGLLPN